MNEYIEQDDREHQHLLVSATINSHPSEQEVLDWITDLVKAIDMKILHGPIVCRCDTPGNQGITAMAIIETSHISLHFWDYGPYQELKMDVYSCKPYSPMVVIDALGDFSASEINFVFIDRDTYMPLGISMGFGDE